MLPPPPRADLLLPPPLSLTAIAAATGPARYCSPLLCRVTRRRRAAAAGVCLARVVVVVVGGDGVVFLGWGLSSGMHRLCRGETSAYSTDFFPRAGGGGARAEAKGERRFQIGACAHRRIDDDSEMSGGDGSARRGLRGKSRARRPGGAIVGPPGGVEGREGESIGFRVNDRLSTSNRYR